MAIKTHQPVDFGTRAQGVAVDGTDTLANGTTGIGSGRLIRAKAATVGEKAYAAANGGAEGVTLYDVTNGEPFAYATTGRQQVVADAAIAAGAKLTVGTSGRAKTAASTHQVIGHAVTAAAAQGDIIEADLTLSLEVLA